MVLFAFITSLIIVAICMWRKIYIPTAFPAIVMALGILNFGVLHATNHATLTQSSLFFSMLVCWFAFWFDTLRTIVTGAFWSLHIAHLLNRFAIGTWIAGNSIVVILFHVFWPTVGIRLEWIVWSNILLWIGYLILIFYTIFHHQALQKSTTLHGAILLAVVSTQSIAVELFTFYPDLPHVIFLIIIGIGLLLYVFLISWIVRKLSLRFWNGTNCIIHGALSITGVATVTTNGLPFSFVIPLWIVTTLLFVAIEWTELRVWRTRYRSREPLLFMLPHISNWSRLFTFCMFFTFSFLFSHRLNFHSSMIVSIFRAFSFLIIMLFVWEGIKYVRSFFTLKKPV